MLGVSISEIFPVQASFSGLSAEPITIIGGIILKLAGRTGISLSTSKLFYVSNTIQNIYLSCDTSISLGAIPAEQAVSMPRLDRTLNQQSYEKKGAPSINITIASDLLTGDASVQTEV